MKIPLFSLLMSMMFLTTTAQTTETELPLKVFKTSAVTSLPMIIFISGDGGLNSFSESLCQSLSQKGVPVVVLDAKKYFWNSRTPDETSSDLSKVFQTYGKLWGCNSFVLVGFSFGASLIPFLVNRFPAGVAGKLALALMISPDKNCDFEVHLTDMLNLGFSKGKYDVINEVERGDRNKMEAVFGSEESLEIRTAFQQTGIKIQTLQGNHHFDSGSAMLADWIVGEISRQ